MKKPYIIIIYTFLIFIFFTLFLSLDKNKIYSPQDLVGKKIKEINLNLFDSNNTFNTKEIENYEFTLLNFWASWCGPCRKEHKYLVKLSRIKNLKIIGINFKDSQPNARKFLQEMGNPFFILTKDLEGKKSVDFGVYGIPESILLNQDMTILKKYIGPLDQKDVNEIKKIIKK